MIGITVTTTLSDIFKKGVGKDIDQALQATSFLVEAEYKKESPVDRGDFRRGVATINKKNGEYTVTTDALSDGGDPYPVYLYHGTGSMRGAPDAGYTSGRVRAGTVLSGIGGIRPNKVAKRAAEGARPNVIKFFRTQLSGKLS